MNWLWKFLLFPQVLRIGGDDGGGGGSGDNMVAEEGRKATLRKRIDQLYGIGTTTPARGPTYDADGFVTDPGTPGSESDPEAEAAAAQMEGENTKLADATRAYHTDQLGRAYTKAERETRFKLARQGLLGGSEDIFQQGEVKSDRDLGATRVDDAVRRAVTGLKTQREQERLGSINLVNSGAGDSAVSSAQAGLRNAADSAQSAQKADLFGDLFTNSADVVAGNNIANQQAALLGRYKNQLATFFPVKGTTGGRITATG